MSFGTEGDREENVQLCAAQKGAIVRQLFGSVKYRKLCTSGNLKRHNIYFNLDRGSNACLRKWPEKLGWSDLITFDVTALGWIPRGQHQSDNGQHYREWLLIDNDITCDNQKVIRELNIFEDLSWTLHILNRQVSQCFGIPTALSGDKHELFTLFTIAAKARLCHGFEVVSRRDTKSTKGVVIGRAENFVRKDKHTTVESLIHRSTGCHMLLGIQNAVRACKCCATLKKNSGKDLFTEDKVPEVSKYKREAVMSEEELKEKLIEERQLKRNALRREQRLRQKLKKEMIVFANKSHEDFKNIFTSTCEKTACDSNPDLLLLWDEQRKMLQCKGPSGRRWHPKIIRMCLSVWMRSPKAYEELKSSGMLLLPSGRLLSMYKNCVGHSPGFNDTLLQWMVKEAENMKLSDDGLNGGIILDEMAIQEDLQLKFHNGEAEVVGLVCLGDENNDMQTLISGQDIAVTATHVLQMVYLGNTGFRFPFAHWPTKEVDPATLYVNFWNAVKWLRKGGFNVTYCCLDGGQANRSFVQMHFKGKDIVKEKFTTKNPFTHEPMVFYMDPWHNFKKIRNGIEKSSQAGKTARTLQNGDGHILWKYWKSAYTFDQETHSLPLHHKLTPDHFDLTPATRMRNHLAEHVLNKDMLYLMKEFKKHRQTQGASSSECRDLDAVILLLSHTSKLITNFTDWRPIHSTLDERLVDNDRTLQYFKEWEEAVYSLVGVSAAQKNKMLLSDKARFDITSMVLGFREICLISASKHPGSGIVAARANSNLVENVFCQQRGQNGQNNNPRYSQYGAGINAICLGQTTTTKRSNSGKVEPLPFFKPSAFHGKRKEREFE
ncbi:uncharacterized protein [Ptychodera flava]|uniref:uncharacterized protein n=1 Tax=Ptychodera flava TaxID=63121 RepID=UPI003969E421